MKNVVFILALIVPTQAYSQTYFCKAAQSVGVKYDMETNNWIPVPYFVNAVFYLTPLKNIPPRDWLNKSIYTLKPDANYAITMWKNTSTGYRPDYGSVQYLCKMPYKNADSCRSLIGVESPEDEIRFSHDLTKFTVVHWGDYNSMADNPEKQNKYISQPIISIGECHSTPN